MLPDRLRAELAMARHEVTSHTEHELFFGRLRFRARVSPFWTTAALFAAKVDRAG